MPSKKTIYIVLGVLFVCFLFGNSGSRKLVRRYFDIYKLKSEISQQKRENILLKKEIYLLENDQSYIERIARKELGLVAPGEVEYRFKKQEN
jgi:cell division protein FtsB